MTQNWTNQNEHDQMDVMKDRRMESLDNC